MKDLFQSTFSSVSTFPYEDYHRDFVQHAPFWLLRSAALAHDDLQEHPGFAKLYSFLEGNAHACWNNPELYPHLFRLLGARTDTEDPLRPLRALEGHLGLRDVSPDMFGHRYFRLHRAEPQTFESIHGDIRTVPDAVLMNDANFPLVYGPVPNLFDDVVGGSISYVGSPLPISAEETTQVVRDAAALLRRYDETLYAGFTETVGTLAITGEWSLGNRTSYSTGSIYTGGIFASLCADTPALLVESLIHEYYHQRLWLWWLIEGPADLPGRDVTMISPVSNQERSVQIMMQALLIYFSLTDYYRWLNSTAGYQEPWVSNRVETLTRGGAHLLTELRGALAGREESLRFVNAIADCRDLTSA